MTTRSRLACLCLVVSSIVACGTALPGTGSDRAGVDGAGGGDGGGSSGDPCGSPSDCGPHQTCLGGRCVGTCDPGDFKCETGCTDDVDCGPGHTCDAGVCSVNDTQCAAYCSVIVDGYAQHGLGNTLSPSECTWDCDHLVPTGEKECVLAATSWAQVQECGVNNYQDGPNTHDRWHTESTPMGNCEACEEWASSGACMVAALNYEDDGGSLDYLACVEGCNYDETCVASCRTQFTADVWRMDNYWMCSVCIVCQEACDGTDLKRAVCPSG